MSSVTSPTTPHTALPPLPEMGAPIEAPKTLSRSSSMDSFKSTTAAPIPTKMVDATATTLEAVAEKTQPSAEHTRLKQVHGGVVGFFKAVPGALKNVAYFIVGLPRVAFEGLKNAWNWAVGGKTAGQLADETQQAGQEIASEAKAGAVHTAQAVENKLEQSAQDAT
jgi:hypothetical protein